MLSMQNNLYIWEGKVYELNMNIGQGLQWVGVWEKHFFVIYLG